MTGGRWIAVSWVSLGMAIITSALWTFSHMGDCPPAMTCARAPWLTPANLGGGVLIWATAIYFIARKTGGRP